MEKAERKYCVYLITNSVNGKQYCGQTGQEPKRRFNQHKRESRKGHGSTLGAALREHGEDSFSFVILRNGLTKKQADEEERLVVRVLLLREEEFGYNVSRGGSGYGRKKRRIVDERAVVKSYLKGMSTTEVGKKFGIDNSTVGLWLHDLGIEVRKAAPPKQTTPNSEILLLYRSGLSSVEIGKKLGISDFVVVDRLKSLGEPIRPAKKELSLPIEKIQELHRMGLALKQLASLAGTTAMTIRSRLLEDGYIPRPLGDWVKRKDLDANKIASMYLSGLNGRQIAETFACSEVTIRSHLLKEGVTFRPRGTRNPRIMV